MTDRYTLHTDGACSGNPGPGGWAYHLEEPWGNVTEATGGDPYTTNNVMELTAAIRGLLCTPPGSKVTLRSDSQYVIKGMTEWIEGWMRRGWKNSAGQPVANQHLWGELWAATMAREVSFEWVKAHADNRINNRVDMLAVDARKRYA